MLVEGMDNSVLFACGTVFLFFMFLLLKYLKDGLFSVRQVNPQLHHDSIVDVDNVRDQNNLLPSAPTEDQAAVRRRNLRSHSQLTCPICLVNSTLPIETNCGHIFCASCIMQYWGHLTTYIFQTKMKCPMCRQIITCLLPLYTNQEQRSHQIEHAQLFDQISNYNRRFSGSPRPLLSYITDLPILLRHVVQDLFSVNGLEFWYRIRMIFLLVVCVFYFISPLDIIPEAVFGIFGFIDDFLVFFLVAIYLCIVYRQIIANRR